MTEIENPKPVDERCGLPSASATYRYEACAGSWGLSEGCAEITTVEMAEWAKSGDEIHAVLAGTKSASSLEPEQVEVHDQCRVQVAAIIAEHIPNESDQPSRIVTKEVRLWLKQGRKKLLSGKADLIHCYPLIRHGLVVDYKTNRGEQDDVDSNAQIRNNIVLAAEEWPDIEFWFGAIVQPLVSSKPAVVKFTREDVTQAKAKLIELLARIILPNQPTNAGLHCKFCPAILKCASARAMLQALGIVDVNADGETLAEYLLLAKAAKPIIKRLEDRAKTLLKENAEAVPGWTLAKAQSMRGITDAFACFKLVTDAGLLDRDTFLKDVVSVGIGDLEKAVGAFKALKPKEAKEAVNTACASVIGHTEKAQSLEQV